MVERKGKEDRINCPVGTFFMDLEKTFGRKSRFNKHLNFSRVSSHCWMTGSNVLRKKVPKRPVPN